MMDIHIITKKDFEEFNGLAKTRWWTISDRTINDALESEGFVYLHQKSHKDSFLGGRILSFNRNGKRIEIEFERDDNVHQTPWPKGRNVHGNPVAIVRH